MLAREIQALIIACIADEKFRRAMCDERGAETAGRVLERAPRAADMIGQMGSRLEAREAEIFSLRDLLSQGIDTIEAHTLRDADGTAVMHGNYECISAIEIEQWLQRAEAALNRARRSTERDRRLLSESR